MRESIEKRTVDAIKNYSDNNRPKLSPRQQHALKLYVKENVERIAMTNGLSPAQILTIPFTKINVKRYVESACRDAAPHYEPISYHC